MDCTLRWMLRRHLYPLDAFAPDVWLWLTGDVNAIAVGSWQWSCTADCAGAACLLGPGAADSHSRARSWLCDIVVRCRPLPRGGRRQLRRATLLRCGRLPRLRHGGASHYWDAARRDRQLGVPVEDHERVRPPAGPPRSSLQSLHPACYAPGLVLLEPPTHSARRVIAGYPGLVGSVPTTISALTALTSLCVPWPGSPPRACFAARGCTWAARPVRPHASLCVIRYVARNGFTGPILASITALTRLASLYAPPPPVRSSGRLGRANRHVVAQVPPR
jgi:hypothetical protein